MTRKHRVACEKNKTEKAQFLERMKDIEANYQKYANYYSKFMESQHQCEEVKGQLAEAVERRTLFEQHQTKIVDLCLEFTG